MSEALNKLRDDYMAGLERVNALQSLLDSKASEPEIQSVLVDLSERGACVGDRTRELERVVQANLGGV